MVKQNSDNEERMQRRSFKKTKLFLQLLNKKFENNKKRGQPLFLLKKSMQERFKIINTLFDFLKDSLIL
jgi:hypothetical protein